MEILVGVLHIGSEVYTRIKAIDMADHERSHITKRMDLLLQLITDLQSRDIEDLPGPAVSALDDVLARIQACEQICETTKQQSKVMKFIKAHINLSQIVQLENELERAVNSANLAVNAVSLVLTDKVHKTVKSESQKTQSLIQNPMAGFYMVDDDNTLKPPAQLPPPQARRDGDLLVVSWSDPNNTSGSLKFYELKYSDTDQLPSISPKYTSIKLGPPKIQPGHTYTIHIRGVNDCGPGEWSQSAVINFQQDEKEHSDDEESCALAQKLPNSDCHITSQPAMASVTSSVGTISISSKYQPQNPTTPSPQPQMQPGATSSPHNMASPAPVEQTLPYPTKDVPGQTLPQTYPTSAGQKLHYPIQGASVQSVTQAKPVQSLQTLPLSPQTTSLPPVIHPTVDPLPSSPVPGAPKNLRVSTKRTETLIKLRWQPSYIYPEAAVYYELEMLPVISYKVSWKVIAATSKLSAKATNLQPNTVYEFRVRAVSADGTLASPYSETIMGSTKGGGTGTVSRSAYGRLSKVAASGSSLFGSSKLKGTNPSGVGEYVFGSLSRGMRSAGNYRGNKAKVEEAISPQSSDSEDEQYV